MAEHLLTALKYMSDWRVLIGLIFAFFAIILVYKKKEKIMTSISSLRFPIVSRKSKIPSWKNILEALYNHSSENYKGNRYLASDKENMKLSESLIFKNDELSSKIAFLFDKKLIGRNVVSKNPYSNSMILTEKGFEMVESIKKEKRQTMLNFSIIYLASAILLVYFFGLVKDLELIGGNLLLYLFLASVFVFAIFIYKIFGPIMK